MQQAQKPKTTQDLRLTAYEKWMVKLLFYKKNYLPAKINNKMCMNIKMTI